MHELVLAEQGRILTDEETLIQAGIASSPFVVLSVKAIAPGATDGAVRPEASGLCAEWWLRGTVEPDGSRLALPTGSTLSCRAQRLAARTLSR